MRISGREEAAGFTLIELSIVLVIIGLIVGGVLTGQDLIRAAEVRATISQIEKYNTAVNTFYGKYQAIPGNMNPTTAAQFGFSLTGRTGAVGYGSGNGLVDVFVVGVEPIMFWVDLSSPVAGGLIDGTFTAGGTYNVHLWDIAGDNLPAAYYLPAAKVGRGNYVWVYSGGWAFAPCCPGSVGDGWNYFEITPPLSDIVASPVPTLTVSQAYSIDKKTDDGLPQTGNVIAYIGPNTLWSAGGGNFNRGDYSSTTNGPVTSAGDIGDGTAAGPLSCYDGSKRLPEQYSVQIDSGAGPNCALSFSFQ